MSIVENFSKQQNPKKILDDYSNYFLPEGIRFPDDFLNFHMEYDVSSLKPNSKMDLINKSQSEYSCRLGFKINDSIFKMDSYFYMLEYFYNIEEFNYLQERKDLVQIGFYGEGTYIGCAEYNFGKIFYFEEGPSFETPFEEHELFYQVADSFTELLSKLQLVGFDESLNPYEIDFDDNKIIYKK